MIKLANYPKVREGSIQLITKQDSPLVQVALADAMMKLKEKKSIYQMKKLLQKVNLDNAVQTKVEESIKTLIF